MNFRTNFSKLCLLSNETIKIYFEDKTVEFVPPTISLYFNDLDFMEFKAILKQNPKDFANYSFGFEVNNAYEALLALLKIGYKVDSILKFLKFVFPNVEFNNSRLEVDGVFLTSEEYMLLIEFLEVSCAEKDFDEFMKKIEPQPDPKNNKEKELSGLAKRFKEVEDKLNELKKSKKKTDEKQKAITIDQIVVAILYEFPSFSVKDVLDMNVVTLLQFWQYVGKVVDTQIQITAAGNGLIKDFTYFIN